MGVCSSSDVSLRTFCSVEQPEPWALQPALSEPFALSLPDPLGIIWVCSPARPSIDQWRSFFVCSQNIAESECKQTIDNFNKTPHGKGKTYDEVWAKTKPKLSEKDLQDKEKICIKFAMNMLQNWSKKSDASVPREFFCHRHTNRTK